MFLSSRFLFIAPLAAAAFLVSSPADAFEHRHAISGGYQFGYVSAKSGGRFDLRSFPISYNGRYGSDWAALFRVSLLIPAHASSGDQSFSPSAEYDSTQGYDAILAPTLRFSRIMKWDLDAGLGPHFNFTRFQSTRYVEWSSAALGVAVTWSARRVVGVGIMGGHPEVGIHMDFSYDAIDLSHGGDLGSGIQGQLALSLAWAAGDLRQPELK